MPYCAADFQISYIIASRAVGLMGRDFLLIAFPFVDFFKAQNVYTQAVPWIQKQMVGKFRGQDPSDKYL